MANGLATGTTRSVPLSSSNGVNFVLHGETGQGYFDAVRAGEHNTQNWWDTQTDPDGVMRTLFHSSNADGGTNRNRYRNAEMDAMIDAAVGIADPEARAAAYAAIQEKIADEVIMVFFWDDVVRFATVPSLKGVITSGSGFTPLFYGAYFE
jgi:ABC-type transport system substrate-binding protein